MSSTTAIPAAAPLAAFSESLSAVVEHVGASTLAVPGRHGRGLASAVVWRSGVVVTAAHVFRRTPAAISMVGADGKVIEATLAGIDSPTDLAVFRVSADAGVVASLGDPARVKAGSLAIAVGRSTQGDLTASYGIVNRTSGPWETWLGGQLDRLIRLDGGLYDGLSGGPVADAGGSVIGIASAALSRSYGIVVPVGTVDRVVDALLSGGQVGRAFLGIGAKPVPVRGEGAERTGLLITDLVSGGPAEAAGVLIGDILVTVDGKPASSLHDLRIALASRIGQNVAATVHRGGVPTELALTVGQWPNEKRRC